MEYEWDTEKAASNQRRHRVDFADAVTIFADEQGITVRDDRHDDEDRYRTLGIDAMGRCLVVVYTWRGKRIRLISARRATAGERRIYAGGE